MLTVLSRLIRKILRALRGPTLRALPSGAEIRHLPRPAVAPAWHDTVVAVGACAFVAGQGARIYSLDAFRPRSPRRPQAA
jgi:hypothetical protein